MSGWQIGDMAVCLVDYTNAFGLAPIRKGEFVTVSRVDTAAREPGTDRRGCGLQFRNKPGLSRAYYKASYFLKVTPPREMIEEERKVGVPA